MTANHKTNSLTQILILVVIIVHLMFFVLEAIFWMNPIVYNILLSFLNNPVTVEYPLQAAVLKNLFINQGFYNLFLSCAGLFGLSLVQQKKYVVGYILILFLCFCGVGAGIVLACSTTAYVLALAQAVPAALAFLRVYRLYKLLPAA